MVRKVLIVVGEVIVPDLGTMPRTIPMNKATPMQLKRNPRILLNKKGEVLKRISTEDLVALDEAIEKRKNWRAL